MKGKRLLNPGIALAYAMLSVGVLSGCSVSPASRMQHARQYEQQGAYRKAAIELKEVIKKEPKNVAARLLLGRVSLRLGEPTYAQQQLERAEKEGADPESVLPLLADSLLSQRDYKKLLTTVRVARSQSSRLQAKLLAARGQALLKTGQQKYAATAFDQALQLVPEQPQALIGQAEMAFSQGGLAKAGQKLDAALRRDPTAMRAWMLKGRIAYKQKDLSSAEADLRRAVKARIQDEPPFERLLARSRLSAILLQQGKNKQALKEINVMLRVTPKQPLPNYLRAVLAYREKHYNLAVEKLQVVLRAIPHDANAQALIGIIKEKQGQDQQAQMYLTNALSADPSNPHIVVTLARLELSMGDRNRALSTLNDAVGRGVTDPMVMGMLENTIMSVGKTGRGLAYLRQNLLPEASNPRVQMSLAKAFMSRGINEPAVDLLKKVRTSGEGEAALREGLLVAALLRSGHDTEALSTAKAAARKHPNVAIWRDLLGNVYVALKRNDAARAQFLTARRLSPEDARATLALASLSLRELKFHEAINELGYLHGNRGEPEAMILMSRAYVGLGHHEKALAILRKAAEKYPNAPAPLLILVRYELGTHQPQMARDQVERALAHHPNNAGLLNLLGLTQLAESANQDAVKSFSKAAHEAPTVVAFQLNLARAQIAQHQLANAIRTLSAARSAHPDNVTILVPLAVAQMRDKRPKAAFAVAKAMQAKARLTEQGDILEGRLFQMQKAYAKAARAFERAARTSGHVDGLELAVMSREKGHIDPPEQPLLRWVHQHKNDVAATILLAQWYSKHNDLKQAAIWYRKATRGHGRYVPIVLNNLAWVYLKQHDRRALPTAERAYRLAPKVAAIADTLGWAQLHAHDFRGASKHLKQAVSEDPENPDMRYHLAYLLAQSGKRSQALQELTQALKATGPFDEKAAAEALQKRLHG